MDDTYHNINGQLAIVGVTDTFTLAQLTQSVADAQANLDYENTVSHPQKVIALQAALDSANALLVQAQTLGVTQ